MDVKSQLLDAQIEHVLDAAKGAVKPGKMIYATDTQQFYVGGTTQWLQVFGSKIGDVKTSMLEDTVFQTEHGSTWILADGRDVTGSDFHGLTTLTNVPDLREMFLRGKQNGRADGKEIGGEWDLGEYEQDTIKSHTHGVYTNLGAGTGQTGALSTFTNNTLSAPIVTTTQSGVAETRPRNVTVNFFIKINR